MDFVDAMTDDAASAFEVGDRDEGTVTGLNLGTGIGVYESLLRSGWRVFGEDALGRPRVPRRARARASPRVDPRNDYWHPGAAARARRRPAPAAARVPARAATSSHRRA